MFEKLIQIIESMNLSIEFQSTTTDINFLSIHNYSPGVSKSPGKINFDSLAKNELELP